MFIIGELINGMYKKVARAIEARDSAFIVDLASRQVQAGADALDINCGPLCADPRGDMRWLVETIQKESDVALSIDHTKKDVIEDALSVCRSGAIINSTTADPARLASYLELASKHSASLIILTVDKRGVPQDKERRLELAAQAVGICAETDFPLDRIYIDPVLMPINVAQNQLFGILDVVKDFKLFAQPPVKTILGLSNISQGAKNRSLINRSFLAMAQSAGLDAAILDPLDKELMDVLISGEVILNRAIYCDSFIEAYLKSKGKC